MLKTTGFAAVAASVLLTAATAVASDVQEKARNLAETNIATWASQPSIVAAIVGQNEKHAGLSQADVDALDKTWRGEVDAGGGALIEASLSNDVSAFLRQIQADSGGQFTEIFVMDNKGLNVGQTDVTSDYWQGDEAKFQQTFSVGTDALHVSDVEFDESTQTYQVQISMTISDGGSPIGAVTVGVNAETLE